MGNSFLNIGEICALLSALSWSLAVILFKKSGERIHPIGLNLYKDILAAILFIPTLYIFGETLLPSLPFMDYFILIVSGIIGIAIADTLFFVSLNMIGASLNSIISCVYSPLLIFSSVLFLSEKITLLQIVGTALVMAAIITTSGERKRKGVDGKELTKGILIGILAIVLMVTGAIMMKPVLNRSPLIWATEIRLFGGIAALIPILLFNKKRKIIIKSLFDKANSFYPILGSFMGAYLAMLLWVAGMKYARVSVAAVLNQTSHVFIFVFAAIFLKERINSHRVLAIILAILGAVLITIS